MTSFLNLDPTPSFRALEDYPLLCSFPQSVSSAQLCIAQLQEINHRIISDSSALFSTLDGICQTDSNTLHLFLNEFFPLLIDSELKGYVKKNFLEKFLSFFSNHPYFPLFLEALCNHQEIFTVYVNLNIYLAYQQQDWDQILASTPKNSVEKEIYLIALFQRKPPKYLEKIRDLYGFSQLCSAEIDLITNFSNGNLNEVSPGFGLVRTTHPLLFSFYMTQLRQVKYNLHPLNAYFELALKFQENVYEYDSCNTSLPSEEAVAIPYEAPPQEEPLTEVRTIPEAHANKVALPQVETKLSPLKEIIDAPPSELKIAVNKRPAPPSKFIQKPAKTAKTVSSQSLSSDGYQELYLYKRSEHPRAVSPLVLAYDYLNVLIRQKANLETFQIQNVIKNIEQQNLDPNFLALKINPEPFEKMSESSSARLTQRFIEQLYSSIRPIFNPKYFDKLEAVSPKALVQKFIDGLALPKYLRNDYYFHFFSHLDSDIKRRMDLPQATVDYLAPKLQKFWKLLAQRILQFNSVKLKNQIRKILEKNAYILLGSKLGFLTFISHAFALLQRHRFFFNAEDLLSEVIVSGNWDATPFFKNEDIDNFDTFEKLLFIETIKSQSQDGAADSEIALFQSPTSIEKLHLSVSKDLSLLKKFTQGQLNLAVFDELDNEKRNPISHFPILYSYAYFFLRKQTKFPPNYFSLVLSPLYLEHVRQQEEIPIYQDYLATLKNKLNKKLGLSPQHETTLQVGKK